VDAREFLGLEATDDPNRFRLPVVQSLCTWGGFLFGGAALGAALTALEIVTGRPAVWATAQYLSFAHPPDELEIEVTVPSAGMRLSQARAIAHVGDREILTVLAALGARPHDAAGSWAPYPEGVRAPDLSSAREFRSHNFHGESVMSRFDQRLARGRNPLGLDGTPGDGSSALWVRLPDDLEVSAAALAILGDFVPFGIGQALGIGAGGTSLDNTIRIASLVPTRWVLVDVFVHRVADGFAHGRVHLWSEDRTLLAIASQSAVVRYWKD
jgi:acyl-CoA thioesterase